MTAVIGTGHGSNHESNKAQDEAKLEKTSLRLLGSSSKNSYDPQLDIDWDADPRLDLPAMPYERVSIYGTPMWDGLTDEQKVTLSQHEMASVAGTGLWFEMILVQMLARYCYHQDPQSPNSQYALTEIGDETRHIVMFAKAINRTGLPTYRPNKAIYHLARVYKATSRGVGIFAPVLVAEEMTDRLQRQTMHDEGIIPIIRMVNRIHVVEEARHVRFAREEVARLFPHYGPGQRAYTNIITAVVSAFVATSLINSQVYAAVGLDPKAAAKVARANPHNHETRRFLAEKIMEFLGEQGMLTWYSRPIYKLAHLI